MQNISNVFLEMPDQYNQKENTMIIFDDCQKILKKIKDNTIDLIFSDPPYNIGKIYENKQGKEEYINWCVTWIDECMRILKITGTCYIMAATQFMPYIDSYIDSNYFIRARIIWYYDSSGVQAKKYFGSMYEPILMVVKDKKKYKFNAKDVMVEAKTGAKRKLIDYRKTPPQQYNIKKVMGNVWNIPRVRYKMEEYENHPTQKPEKLLEIIIRASSDPNDVVLDPFSGSFTTNVVAQKLGRKTIGIESIEEYYKIGLRRLNIIDEYKGEELIKLKKRKTRNKSKVKNILPTPY